MPRCCCCRLRQQQPTTLALLLHRCCQALSNTGYGFPVDPSQCARSAVLHVTRSLCAHFYVQRPTTPSFFSLFLSLSLSFSFSSPLTQPPAIGARVPVRVPRHRYIHHRASTHNQPSLLSFFPSFFLPSFSLVCSNPEFLSRCSRNQPFLHPPCHVSFPTLFHGTLCARSLHHIVGSGGGGWH